MQRIVELFGSKNKKMSALREQDPVQKLYCSLLSGTIQRKDPQSYEIFRAAHYPLSSCSGILSYIVDVQGRSVEEEWVSVEAGKRESGKARKCVSEEGKLLSSL